MGRIANQRHIHNQLANPVKAISHTTNNALAATTKFTSLYQGSISLHLSSTLKAHNLEPITVSNGKPDIGVVIGDVTGAVLVLLITHWGRDKMGLSSS